MHTCTCLQILVVSCLSEPECEELEALLDEELVDDEISSKNFERDIRDESECNHLY